MDLATLTALLGQYIANAPGYSVNKNELINIAGNAGADMVMTDQALVDLVTAGTLTVDTDADGAIWYTNETLLIASEDASVTALFAGEDDAIVIKAALVAAGFRPRRSRRGYRVVGNILARAQTKLPADSDLHGVLTEVRAIVNYVAAAG